MVRAGPELGMTKFQVQQPNHLVTLPPQKRKRKVERAIVEMAYVALIWKESTGWLSWLNIGLAWRWWWVQTLAGPTLRVFTKLRRKCCLCNDICKWLDLLVVSDRDDKL